MIIYTANIGEKDEFVLPKAVQAGVKYVYFVDDKSKYESSVWDVREVERKFDDSKIDAKWYKMHPHLLFPGENTFWIDANFRPVKYPSRLFIRDLGLYRHGNRDCVYAEATHCLWKRVGNAELIRKQIAYYEEQGMPRHFGLFLGGVLMRTPAAASFNEVWWEETLRFSARDQLSLPYALWKTKIPFASFNVEDHNKYCRRIKRHLWYRSE